MIGILAATDMEVRAILGLGQPEKTETIAGIELHYGRIKGKDLVLAKTGIGKSHAAMATTILCTRHPLEFIINIGTAGGLRDEQNRLDLVFSTKVVQADFDTRPIDGPEALGLMYEADPDLLEKALRAAKKAGLHFHQGVIASQDIFMAHQEDFDKLMMHFPDSVCSEMEGAAVGQVAADFQIPFLVVRSLSDIVSHPDNGMDYWEYAYKASVQIARWLDELL